MGTAWGPMMGEGVVQRTQDSFQNFEARIGVGTDNSSSAGTYGFNPVTRDRQLLEWIHRGSWIGGIAVDCVGDDMTRAGIEITSELAPDDGERIQQALDRLNIWGALSDTVKWSRLYGGAVAVYLIDGQDPSTPLKIEATPRDGFRGLLVLDRWMVMPSIEELVTDLGPHFGTPMYYSVVATGAGIPTMRVHYTRVVRLEGVRLPYWQRVAENYWGLSVLERLYDRMLAFDSATQGAAQLVYRAYLRTISVEGMRDIIAMGGPAYEGLIKYTEMMRRFQSMEGVTMVDAKDKFEASTHGAFGGLSDILQQFGQQLSGALQIPLVRLFGQSPSGLNSSGDSDLRTYYDNIKQQQERVLHQPLLTIVLLVCHSLGIKVPKGLNLEFRPLWQLREEEKANIAKTITDTVLAADEAGVLGPGVALQELRQSSHLTGIWTNITDEDIEEAKSAPPEPSEAEEKMKGRHDPELNPEPVPARGAIEVK